MDERASRPAIHRQLRVHGRRLQAVRTKGSRQRAARSHRVNPRGTTPQNQRTAGRIPNETSTDLFHARAATARATVGAVRSSVQYIAIRPPQTALRTRIREIAEVRVAYGYRRITVLLR